MCGTKPWTSHHRLRFMIFLDRTGKEAQLSERRCKDNNSNNINNDNNNNNNHDLNSAWKLIVPQQRSSFPSSFLPSELPWDKPIKSNAWSTPKRWYFFFITLKKKKKSVWLWLLGDSKTNLDKSRRTSDKPQNFRRSRFLQNTPVLLSSQSRHSWNFWTRHREYLACLGCLSCVIEFSSGSNRFA